MIKSFKHKGLQAFYENGSLSGIQARHRQNLRMQLVAVDTATVINDLDLPGYRLHPLKGKMKGLWSIEFCKTGGLLLSLGRVMSILSIMRIITNGHAQSATSWRVYT